MALQSEDWKSIKSRVDAEGSHFNIVRSNGFKGKDEQILRIRLPCTMHYLTQLQILI